MKVRVVQIITRLELGGAQEVTLYTARNLDRGRYDVTLITGVEDALTSEARALPDTEFIEVPELVREVSPLKDLRALAALTLVIRRRVKGSPGGVIVHTHSSKAGILGRWAAFLAGAKVVVHSIHGYGFNDHQSPLVRTVYKAVEKLTARVTDGFAADSQANIDKGAHLGLFRKAHAEVIRSGIEVESCAAGPGGLDKSALGIPGDAPLDLMVSCLKPQKAPVDFVKVAAKVHGSVPDAHFVLVGDGELKVEVEAEAARAGLAGRFHMLGWRRDVRDLIHLCDVMALTSVWEGLPRVVLSAMAAGRPVVATAVDGTPEAVRDGVNGFLAPPHDVDRLAEKTALLLTDKGLSARMGEAGRAMVHEFDEGEMLRRIEALYDSLLKEES